MGAADVVPGVSGGTIAFISGIYDTLLNAIRSFNAKALQLLFAFKLKELWQHLNGTFLAVLLSGIATSIILFARVVLYLMEAHPIFLWSFFLGLVLASALLVGRKIQRWNAPVVLSLAIGTALAYYITVAVPIDTPAEWWFIFLSGAIAICAMILPGISGSFILLLLGKYHFILSTVKDLTQLKFSAEGIITIVCFATGCVTGLLSFSHLLNWLLKRHYDLTVALLTGFMLGSLNKVWPWREVIRTYTNSKGEVKTLLDQSVLPQTFEQLTGQDPQLLWAIVLLATGFAIVYFIEKASETTPTTN